MTKYQEALDKLCSRCYVESEECTCHARYKGGKCYDSCEHKEALQELVDQQAILEEYNVTPENIREVLLTGQMFRLQPAFFECVKEWNQKGWLVDIHKCEITISDNRSLAEISIDRKDKAYWCSHYLSFELHYLLTKTLKALEGMKDD